jgi:baseplate J-like protein
MYVELALVGDTTSLTQSGLNFMSDSIPGFTARPGNVETILVQASGQIQGELLDQAMYVPAEAFAALGTSVYGIPMLDGQQAYSAAVVTWAADTPASQMPAGTQVGVPNGDGSQYVFETDRTLVAPNGGGVQDVVLIARDVGEAMNDSFGECEMIDEIEGVESIIANGAIGGADDETADAYLDRLTTILALLAPRPILPEDHAALASTVPGVGRVSVINLYYPGTTARDAGLAVGDFDKPLPPKTPPYDPVVAATNIPRCTTVAITGENGAVPDNALMTAVYQLLDTNREVNFLNFVMKPQYTSVDVRAVVTPYPNRTKQDAIDSSAQMVTDWLSPTGYGIVPGAGAGTAWSTTDKLRIYEVVDYLNRGAATWYVESVFVKLSSSDDSAWQNTDLSLPGVFPVPVLGTVQLT